MGPSGPWNVAWRESELSRIRAAARRQTWNTLNRWQSLEAGLLGRQAEELEAAARELREAAFRLSDRRSCLGQDPTVDPTLLALDLAATRRRRDEAAELLRKAQALEARAEETRGHLAEATRAALSYGKLAEGAGREPTDTAP